MTWLPFSFFIIGFSRTPGQNISGLCDAGYISPELLTVGWFPSLEPNLPAWLEQETSVCPDDIFGPADSKAARTIMTGKKQESSAAAYQSVLMFTKYQKIYAKRARGFFDNWRVLMVLLTQVIFYGGVWLEWNDRQALLLHLVERKFYIFGVVFWPQDIIYLTAILIVSAYALFLVTAIAGRLFCGYACPQTVYTQLFMWIENWVEGERNDRIKLDNGPLTLRKIRIKVTKHLLWGTLALWTGFTLAGYFSPVRELWHNLLTWNLGGWETFWIFFYAGFTYLMAGNMRELVCRHMCPYARFQSAMFDPDTMIITYDNKRGEPRGQRTQGAENQGRLGDCVDCGLCVRVCPTGIDIRNGLQYECIGCASCVDICNQVMEKVGLPTGLVRYSTENAIAGDFGREEIVQHIIRPRVLGYSAVLVLVMLLAAWFLAHRISLKVDVIRDRTMLTREVEDGRIENIFTLNVMNTEEAPHRYRISVEGLPEIELAESGDIEVPAASSLSAIVRVLAPAEAGKKGANPIHFEIVAQENKDIRVREKASFLMP
jgi:cytochrome c oxidase accessory protein FixG